MKTWRDYPIRQTTKDSKDFPKRLKGIKNCPKSLYYRGTLSPNLFEKTLSIVGSRRVSRYGKEVVDLFMPHLIEQKITIISGFMYGIDTLAHQKALEYGGVTVAVFGSGLNCPYPPENETLYTQILQNSGTVLSEYDPDYEAQLWTFPQRNRIVAGLATLGVLVVEAGEKSGSLITARLAREMDKNIFSVPGPITSPVSAGTNELIKSGRARMITTPQDITGKFVQATQKIIPEILDPIEQKIYQALEINELSVDELAQVTKKDVITLGTMLSLMCLKGIVKEEAGKYRLV